MPRGFLLFIIFLLVLTPLLGNNNPYQVIGFWKSMDSKGEFITSIIAVYEYEETLYGRVIVGFNEKTGILEDTYVNPVIRIEKHSSKPLLTEVDLFWGHTLNDKVWKGGKIIDPRSGYSFNSDIWIEKGNLIIRGKFGPFGVRQLFYRAYLSDMPKNLNFPDLNNFRPSPIPR